MMRSDVGSDEEKAGARLVEVEVPPGPLGILLDDAGPGGGAYLDGFAAVSADESERGAVETSARVPAPGSVLLRVNEYDFVAEGMTFAAIGQVLRDTSHLPRTLCFRVPHADLDSDDEDSDDDDDEEYDSDEVEEVETDDGSGSFVHDVDAAMGVVAIDTTSSSTPDNGGSMPTTGQNSPSGVSNNSNGSWTAVKAPAAVAKEPKPAQGGGPALVPTTAISSAAGRLAPSAAFAAMESSSSSLSPSSMATYRPSQSLAAPSIDQSDDSPTDKDEIVRVQVPPGPLGLNLDGGVLDRAVVLGFVPLRGGEKGVLETHGGVLPGSQLVEVDEVDVSKLTLDEIRVLLGERSAQSRCLGFRPSSPDAQATWSSLTAPTNRLPSFTALVEDLKKRRKLEVALIMKYDTANIKRGQCWFMLSTAWLTRWVEFAAKGGSELPGPIANDALLADGWRERRRSSDPGRPDVPCEGLVLSKDYRGVSPMVWCLFAELHGLGEAPLLPRYLLDIYAEGLSEAELTNILREPRLKATVLANNLRDACLVRSSK